MEGDAIHMGCSFLVGKEGIMTLSGTAGIIIITIIITINVLSVTADTICV
jgi:hypothetical protein